MRGKADATKKKPVVVGITPAYAGKRQRRNICTYIRQDHPRLCGEKTITGMGDFNDKGSPPPMRGKVLG